MDHRLFALVLARMEYRQANFQSCFAPFSIVQHRPILGHGFIKIFELDLKRAAPLRTWNFGPATLIIDKDPIGRLPQCAALAADQRQTKERLARFLISVAIATLDLERDAGAARVFVELPFGARFSSVVARAQVVCPPTKRHPRSTHDRQSSRSRHKSTLRSRRRQTAVAPNNFLPWNSPLTTVPHERARYAPDRRPTNARYRPGAALGGNKRRRPIRY